MGVPETIRVMGQTFGVRLLDLGLFDNGGMGRCREAVGLIDLNANMVADAIRSTLLHEAIHAIDDRAAIGLEERQVRALEGGLFALLRDNPGFAAWLLETGEEGDAEPEPDTGGDDAGTSAT